MIVLAFQTGLISGDVGLLAPLALSGVTQLVYVFPTALFFVNRRCPLMTKGFLAVAGAVFVLSLVRPGRLSGGLCRTGRGLRGGWAALTPGWSVQDAEGVELGIGLGRPAPVGDGAGGRGVEHGPDGEVAVGEGEARRGSERTSRCR